MEREDVEAACSRNWLTESEKNADRSVDMNLEPTETNPEVILPQMANILGIGPISKPKWMPRF